MNKKYCAGCRNDFYNGNNDLGVPKCWSFKAAKVIWRKAVHVDHRPPWTQKAERYADCYTQSRYVFVGPKVTC